MLCWPARFLITKMDGQRAPRTPIEDGGLTRTRPSRGVAHASRSRGARRNSSCQPANNQPTKVSLRVPLRERPRVLLICHPGKGCAASASGSCSASSILAGTV